MTGPFPLEAAQTLRFRVAGFEILKANPKRFAALPEAASRRCREFATLTGEDLMINACDLVVRRPA